MIDYLVFFQKITQIRLKNYLERLAHKISWLHILFLLPKHERKQCFQKFGKQIHSDYLNNWMTMDISAALDLNEDLTSWFKSVKI